ncbi:hypothetical protein K523DRAFT_92134 [Schizophyllum commune Tattone D]|nr:hypothetical protein K523DRAFT_92134 [Schizophyllum commune Tattone D]
MTDSYEVRCRCIYPVSSPLASRERSTSRKKELSTSYRRVSRWFGASRDARLAFRGTLGGRWLRRVCHRRSRRKDSIYCCEIGY